MARRSDVQLKDTKDLEMLARIAAEPNYRWKAPPMGLDEPEYRSLDRLIRYKLVSGGTLTFVGTAVASRTYRLTQKGKQAYSDALEGLEKHLPGPNER